MGLIKLYWLGTQSRPRCFFQQCGVRARNFKEDTLSLPLSFSGAGTRLGWRIPVTVETGDAVFGAEREWKRLHAVIPSDIAG
eukprot:scaffold24136_cov131-Isochrysis_galbana.AAC.4